MFITKQIDLTKLEVNSPGLNNLNEKGSALTAVIVVLLILSMIAGVALMSSQDEIQIAGNDRQYRITQNEADGATELAAELLEQNMSCPGGFTNSVRGDTSDTFVDIKVDNLVFWLNGRELVETPSEGPDHSDADDDVRDFYLPVQYTPGEPHTNFTVGGGRQWAMGAAIQMAAGYEGKGKGAGQGGGLLMYEIFTQRLGELRSEALCKTEWRHVVGQEGTCIP